MVSTPVNLFFNTGKAYGAGALSFDLLLSEDHSLESSVTSHPVEDGSEINDHLQNETPSGNITGLITNFSIKSKGIISNRAQDAFDLLYQLWEDRKLVTIYTMLRVYENMAITSAPVSRDNETGESLILQIEFQKVRVVALQQIVLETNISLKSLDKTIQRKVSPTTSAGNSVGSSTGASIV